MNGSRFALMAGMALLGAVAITSLTALADAQSRPSTRPADAASSTQRQQDERGDGRRGGQDRDGDRGGQDGPGRGPPQRGMWAEPDSQQWEEALVFLRENSPRRLAIYDRAVAEWRQQQADPTTQPELPRGIRRARAIIFGRVQLLRMVEERDPPLHALSLRQFRLEDEIIGSLDDAHQARKAGNDEAAAAAHQKAQETVRSYALGTLEEREARIQRMRDELSREEQRLQEDRQQMDRLVERLLERFRRSVPGAENPRPESGDGQRGGDGR